MTNEAGISFSPCSMTVRDICRSCPNIVNMTDERGTRAIALMHDANTDNDVGVRGYRAEGFNPLSSQRTAGPLAERGRTTGPVPSVRSLRRLTTGSRSAFRCSVATMSEERTIYDRIERRVAENSAGSRCYGVTTWIVGGATSGEADVGRG